MLRVTRYLHSVFHDEQTHTRTERKAAASCAIFNYIHSPERRFVHRLSKRLRTPELMPVPDCNGANGLEMGARVRARAREKRLAQVSVCAAARNERRGCGLCASLQPTQRGSSSGSVLLMLRSFNSTLPGTLESFVSKAEAAAAAATTATSTAASST